MLPPLVFALVRVLVYSVIFVVALLFLPSSWNLFVRVLVSVFLASGILAVLGWLLGVIPGWLLRGDNRAKWKTGIRASRALKYIANERILGLAPCQFNETRYCMFLPARLSTTGFKLTDLNQAYLAKFFTENSIELSDYCGAPTHWGLTLPPVDYTKELLLTNPPPPPDKLYQMPICDSCVIKLI